MSTADMTGVESRAGFSARRALAAAGAVYVAAWLLGLATAPSAPSPDASDAAVQAFYADHGSATLAQATLVHGVAGLALGVFVVALARRLTPDTAHPVRRLFVAAGVGAAAVSLLQLALEIGLNRAADAGKVSTSAALFHAVNIADTVKLVLLAVSVAAATHLAARTHALPRWLRGLGYALAPILIIGGAAFVITSDALSAVLAVSLLLLLLWVAAVSVATTRAATAPRPHTAPS
jgi:hypothetical protein